MTSDPSPFRCTEAEKAAAPPLQPSQPHVVEMSHPEVTDSGWLPALVADTDTDSADNHKTIGILDYIGFAPSRRMKRLTYCTATFFVNSIYIFLIFFSIMIFGDTVVVEWSWICLGIIVSVVHIRLAIQRCRDIGWTFWMILPLLIGSFVTFAIANSMTYRPSVVIEGIVFYQQSALDFWAFFMMCAIVVASGIFLLFQLPFPSQTKEGAPQGIWGIFWVEIFFYLPAILFLLFLLAIHLDDSGLP